MATAVFSEILKRPMERARSQTTTTFDWKFRAVLDKVVQSDSVRYLCMNKCSCGRRISREYAEDEESALAFEAIVFTTATNFERISFEKTLVEIPSKVPEASSRV